MALIKPGLPLDTDQPADQDGRDSRRLDTIYKTNDLLKRVVGQGLKIEAALPEVLQAIIAELQGYSGSIIVVDEDSRIQYNWLISENRGGEGPSAFMDQAIKRGLFGWTVLQQKPALVDDTTNDDRWLPRPGHITAREPWSAICVPMIIRARSIGAIMVTRPGQGQFTTDDVHLMSAIANQAASTLESARLYEESRRQATDLSALVEVSTLITAQLDSGALLDTLGRELTRFADADGCAIYEWDVNSNQVSRLKFFAQSETIPDTILPDSFYLPDYPLTQRVLEMRFPVRLESDQPEKAHAEYQDMALAGFHSLLMVPMVSQEHAVGLVELVQTEPLKKFNNGQVNLVQTLANQAAVALLNARLYENTQRQLKVTALLNQASQVISSSLDTRQILQSLLAQMNELLNANAISIALWDAEAHELVYEVAEGPGRDTVMGLRIPDTHGVTGWVVQNREPALVSDTSEDSRFNHNVDQKTGYITEAIICAPLLSNDFVLGSIQAINPLDGEFTVEDLELLTNLANLASIALLNARQYERTQFAEARYLGLFEDSVNPILLTNEAGHIVEANHRAEDFLGFRHGELLGQPILDLHVVLDNGKTRPQFALADVNETGVQVFNTRVQRNGGPPVPVEVYVKRTQLHGQSLLQWIYRDITQEVELDKMREDLTAMLVHDLQSPLGNVISSLEILRNELPANKTIDSILDISLRSSNRLQVLIRSLLDLNHLEAGHPVKNPTFTLLPNLIADAVDTMKATMERRQLSLRQEIPTDPPPSPIFGDKDMIRRVIINLLDNAVKYSPDNTTITIVVQPYPEEEDRLLVSIIDQCRRIPAEFRSVIFQKFRRIQDKNAPKGIGLGLAFCRLAVEAHGGCIWVDDAPQGGARFNFTLPTQPFNE
jgi:PAS domain S-box-containing protein